VVAALTESDVAVWAAVVVGVSAVLSGAIASIVSAWATRRTLRANAELARAEFLRERQADTYVRLGDQIARVRAWANIAVDEAKGLPPRFAPKPGVTDDDWYATRGRLAVFGTLLDRVQFDEMVEAALVLQALVVRQSRGAPAAPEEVDVACRDVHNMAARLAIVLASELGPYGDELRLLSYRRWQFWKKKGADRRLKATQQILQSKGQQREYGKQSEPTSEDLGGVAQ